MSKMSRDKGARGELEIAAMLSHLTGREITRRCRRHGLDDDLIGVPGWSVEVKRHKNYTRGDLARWWQQAEEQSRDDGLRPVLFVRRDYDEWRAIWCIEQNSAHDYAQTVEATPAVWAALEGIEKMGGQC